MKRYLTITDKSLVGGENRNQLLWRAMRRTYFPCLLLALIFNAGGLVDSILSGMYFSSLHIAAVGVALPINSLVISVLFIFVQGTYSSYSTCLVRGQRRKGVEVFTTGLIYILVFGTVFSCLVIIFAEPIVIFYGAITPWLQMQTIKYLRFTALCYPFISAAKLITYILNVYGYQKDSFLANLMSLVCNIVFSIVFMALFPNLGIGALGLGTLVSSIVTMLICFWSVRRHNLKIILRTRAEGFSLKRIKELFFGGISVSVNGIIDSQIAGLINIIIVNSVLGVEGLAMYAIINNFWVLSFVPSEGMDYAATPILCMAYASGDKAELKTSFYKAVKKSIIYTIIWIAILFCLLPVLLKLYLWSSDTVLESIATARLGIYITLAFTPFASVIYLLASFFDSTEGVGYSLLFNIIPDSVIFPILLFILLPRLGYLGIWLSVGGATVLALVLYYGVTAWRKKTSVLNEDQFLHLENGHCANNPTVDISVNYLRDDVCDLTEKIHRFLKKQKVSSRVAYAAALCTEELLTDIISHGKKSMDKSLLDRSTIACKIIAEEKMIRVIFLNMGKPYNPMDFEYTNDDFTKVGVMLVQKIAKKIDYSYFYKTNMLTIQLKK